MLYTIGEMAERLGVSASTLRYYDREGLLPFVERTSGGKRLFKESDYEWLNMIECLKRTGMKISDIKSFIYMALDGDSTIAARLKLIEEQRKVVENKLAELSRTLEVLEFKCWYYETALSVGTTDIPRRMSNDELPPQFREIRRLLRGEK